METAQKEGAREMPDYEKAFQEDKEQTYKKWEGILAELSHIRDRMNERCGFCNFTAVFHPPNLDGDPYPTKWQRIEGHHEGLCFRCPALRLCYDNRIEIMSLFDDTTLKLHEGLLALSKLELGPPWVSRKEGEPAESEEGSRASEIIKAMIEGG